MGITASQPDQARCTAIEEDFLFSPPANERVYQAGDLCAPETAIRLLDPILSQHQGEDRAAVMSKWSQWYFARLLTPWARINMLYHWQLPCSPRSIGFTQSEAAVPRQFILTDAGSAVPPGRGQERFDELMACHLTPLCQTLGQLAGIGPGLFWHNAAIRLNHGFNLAKQQGADIAIASAFLASRTLPDGKVNRLYQPIRIFEQPGGAPKSIRRQCCLCYRLAGLDYCPGCPLAEAGQRKMRRKF